MLGRVGKGIVMLVVVLAVAAPASAASLTRGESSLLRQMNRVRRANGLGTLHVDGTLRRAAVAHTVDMLHHDYFAHGDFTTRMRQYHVRGSYAGENLAWGVGDYARARTVVAEWLASPEHRANLLRPGFRRVGISRRIGAFAGHSDAAVITADFAG